MCFFFPLDTGMSLVPPMIYYRLLGWEAHRNAEKCYIGDWGNEELEMAENKEGVCIMWERGKRQRKGVLLREK